LQHVSTFLSHHRELSNFKVCENALKSATRFNVKGVRAFIC
jgi:hypothetical protein